MMNRKLTGKRPTFHPKKGGNFYRIMLWIGLILTGVWVLLGFERGQLKSPLEPTPTPTRVPESYFLEAQAYFEAGKLDDPGNELPGSTNKSEINDAIEAYEAALAGDPTNARAWAELARIQVYSSSLLRNDAERLVRLESALQSANRAVELEPDESVNHAIRSFALDWLASNPLVDSERSEELLNQAELAASRALQLDSENPLALAFYAEILADNQKWLQAEKFATQAVSLGPELMDTHRVRGYVMETLAQYNEAIKEYLEAARISPNMTFLYLRIGANFREGIKNPVRALEYFEKAAVINQQLGVDNPRPYIEIARTYSQEGQFFAASINAQKALELDKFNANTYGQLGLIYRRARNYEGAMPLLQCAVVGCTAEENEIGGVAVEGLPLTNPTVAYYYVEYGTNLAFLSRPTENYCPQAIPILDQVKKAASQWNDPFLVAIAEDSEGICRRVMAAGTQPTQATPQASPTPEEMQNDMIEP
jgi:tetratricopeptide (TPR) repeat protein